MNDTINKVVLTLDVATDTAATFNLGNYLHFNYVSLIVDYVDMNATDATVTFVQNDDGTPVWNEVPSLSAALDDVTGDGSFELANAQFTAAFVGATVDFGTATEGTITITLIAKSW